MIKQTPFESIVLVFHRLCSSSVFGVLLFARASKSNMMRNVQAMKEIKVKHDIHEAPPCKTQISGNKRYAIDFPMRALFISKISRDLIYKFFPNSRLYRKVNFNESSHYTI